MSELIGYGRRLARGTTFVFTGLILANLITLFIRMFLARSLSLTEYGLFYGVLVFVSFFTTFRELGFPPALAKYIPEFIVKKRFSKIKSLIVAAALPLAISGFIIATFLFLLSDQIALTFFRTETASVVLKILSVWFFLTGISIIFQATVQGLQRMGVYAIMEFSNVFFVLIFALLLVGVLGYGTVGIASAYLLASLAMLSFGLLLFKTFPQIFKGKTSVSKPLVKKLSIFALPVFAASIMGTVIAHAGTLILIAFRPLDEVALFQSALPTAQLLGYLPSAMSVVFLPMVSEMWARPGQKFLLPALHFVTKFSFIFMLPLGLIFIAFPDIILRLLFGSGFVAGATALQILTTAMLVLVYSKIMSATLAGIGKPEIIMKCNFLSGCFVIAGNLLLVPIYGIQGAAVAHLLAFTSNLLFKSYFVKKLTTFTVPILPLIKTLVGAILTLILIFFLKHVLMLPPWPEAFAVTIVGFVFYGMWILITKAITRDDLRRIVQIVPMPKWLVKFTSKIVKG